MSLTNKGLPHNKNDRNKQNSESNPIIKSFDLRKRWKPRITKSVN